MLLTLKLSISLSVKMWNTQVPCKHFLHLSTQNTWRVEVLEELQQQQRQQQRRWRWRWQHARHEPPELRFDPDQMFISHFFIGTGCVCCCYKSVAPSETNTCQHRKLHDTTSHFGIWADFVPDMIWIQPHFEFWRNTYIYIYIYENLGKICCVADHFGCMGR